MLLVEKAMSSNPNTNKQTNRKKARVNQKFAMLVIFPLKGAEVDLSRYSPHAIPSGTWQETFSFPKCPSQVPKTSLVRTPSRKGRGLPCTMWPVYVVLPNTTQMGVVRWRGPWGSRTRVAWLQNRPQGA